MTRHGKPLRQKSSFIDALLWVAGTYEDVVHTEAVLDSQDEGDGGVIPQVLAHVAGLDDQLDTVLGQLNLVEAGITTVATGCCPCTPLLLYTGDFCVIRYSLLPCWLYHE